MTTFWRRWSLLAIGGVSVYALGLVVAGPVATSLFEALGFGPDQSGVPSGGPEEYVAFVYTVVGSVIVGWMVLLAAVVAGPLADGEPWAWPAVVASIGVWFVLDTGASLALGFWTHAVFNVGFLVLIGVPLTRVSPGPRPRTSRRTAPAGS